MRGTALLLAAAVGVTGCYDQPRPNCTFACGPSDACPPAYQCGSDDVCHLVLDNGELAVCQFPTIDGGPADAQVDAMVDAEPSIDAALPPDARIDAEPPPDARVDAVPPIDAVPLPDAAPPAVEMISCVGVTPDATITTSSSAYIPVTTTITAGQVIKFDPLGMAHDMVAGTPVAPTPAVFDTPLTQIACLRFNAADSYQFFCSVHEFTGTLIVNP